MSKVNVLNWEKEVIGQVELSSEVFDLDPRIDILQAVVRWQLACRRSGTHMVKTRAFVSGGGKKPFKQKGTGNARQGTNRSPLMPGGAKLFGPIPKSYAYALPKKVRRLALKMALSSVNKDGLLFVVDKMSSNGKSAELSKRFKKFGINKALIVDANVDEMFSRASKNLADFKYMPVEGLNVFDILKYKTAVISKDSIQKIVERCV